MRKISGLVLLLLIGTAGAQSLLETTDQVGKRQDAERYEQWQQRRDKPLGGYKESLGLPYQGSEYREGGGNDPYRGSSSSWRGDNGMGDR